MLAQGGEHDAACRGVDTHGERLRRKQQLQSAVAEQALDGFLEEGQQTRVVHANAAEQQATHALQLRQAQVGGGEAAESPGAERVDMRLFFSRREIQNAS